MNFELLKNTFQDSIKSFSYYVDWQKVQKNLSGIEKQLNILNYLLGKKDNFRDEFMNLISEYPSVIEALPILLATRENKISITSGNLLSNTYTFTPFLLTTGLKEEYYTFVVKTGLIEIFTEDRIKNLVDYVFGIEVGLDSNARKNRSGTNMELLVKKYLEDITVLSSGRYVYKEQATPSWIQENWNVHINVNKSERRFDFAIFDNDKKGLFLVETNFYGGGGSKLKAVAGEFSGLYIDLKNQGIKLIWVTDGAGWQTAIRPLEEAYNVTDGNIYNLSMLKDGILNELIK
ncbi:TPA: restriction endonuclease [Candidatus Gracilibacteria bacterium]|nr:restriction endonuclease [Candidatus Gracilibacteria bacterium]